MSSILDALQKVESAAPPTTYDLRALPVEPPRHQRRLAVILAAIAGGTVAALVAGVLWWLGGGFTPREHTVAAATASAPALRIAKPVPAPVVADRPWVQTDAPPTARVETPAPPPPAPVVARAAPREEPPPVLPVRPAVDPPPVVVPAPPAAFTLPPPEPAARPAPSQAGPASLVRVSFLFYSRVPERRTVALRLEDGSIVTLREGQDRAGFQVTRILPDRVELLREGQSLVVYPTVD